MSHASKNLSGLTVNSRGVSGALRAVSHTGRSAAIFRPGVTLLEVLFSIGIVAIGLLGVVAILPVAGNRVSHGTITDMADRVGRNGIRQFEVQQMRRHDFNNSAWNSAWTQLYFPTGPGSTTPYHIHYAATIPEPVCLDPLFIATRMDNNAITPVTAEVSQFPAIASTSGIRRLSLRVLPGKVTSVNSGVATVPGMGRAQAEQIFMCQDDLVTSLPTDTGLPADQLFVPDGTGTNRVKRNTEGAFSWMATLAPKDVTSGELFVLSVVVFHRRDVTGITSTADAPDTERLVDVKFSNPSVVYGDGLGGGTLLLQTRASARPAVDLDVREGDWLMLLSGGVNRVLKWYRVQGAEREPQVGRPAGNTLYTRMVTVFGPDWDTSLACQAVLLNGVVAVYEKTIRLETSSSWTPWNMQ